MRQIVLDTETTGLYVKKGHRLIEIGCVELVGGIRTGVEFHRYINPEREVDQEAFLVHGLSTDFLKSHSVFSEIADDFIAFIHDSPLIIHNARFDLEFLNAELERIKRPTLQNTIIDTLTMARAKFPGSPASLNALCKMFEIDLSERTHHGALLDAQLLARVYVELTGGTQASIFDTLAQPLRALNAKEHDPEPFSQKNISAHEGKSEERPFLPLRVFEISSHEREDHEKLLAEIGAKSWC